MLVILAVVAVPAQAQEGGPYAWPHFTPAPEGGFDIDRMELNDWLTSFIYCGHGESMDCSEEEIAITTYNWTDSPNGPIDGFFDNFTPQNNGGLNAASDFTRIFPVSDVEDEAAFRDAAVQDLEDRAEFLPEQGRISHTKAVTMGEESVIFGTGNFTFGGYQLQPNTWMVMNRDHQVGRQVAGFFHDKLLDMYNGNNWINDPGGFEEFTGPNGERIEVYFYPDVHGNIPEDDLAGVIEREVNDANESVHYTINRMTEQSGVLNTLTDGTDGLFLSGIHDGSATDAGASDDLRSDHTSRDWQEGPGGANAGQLHHKNIIVDQETIIVGSANHTVSAMEAEPEFANQEFLVVIDDFRLARRFMGEYRRLMGRTPPDSQGPDEFETDPPDPVENLTIEDTGASIDLAWDAPEDPGDFSHYYVFVNQGAESIDTQEDICDFEDSNNSGMICDDPVSDVTGFPAGPSPNQQSMRDNNANGEEGSDPFLFPEAKVDADAPGEVEQAVVDSHNYGQDLESGEEYTVGVVAADRHGNESDAVFVSTSVGEGDDPPPDEVEEFVVAPNPYRPNDGRDRTGDPAEGILFDNLPDDYEISVYMLTGEEVVSDSDRNSDNRWEWQPVADRYGDPVASGYYLVNLENLRTGETKQVKLAIIR